MKRIIDLIFCILGLFIVSPLFIIIAIWIKIDSKGPIFYRQVRVGRYGKDFKIFKFRSMRLHADEKGLLTVGMRDPRITKSGYFIRKYKIDELPQLINVLIGDMSLVGPRPEVRKYVELYNEEQKRVLDVRPGITDYASIEYRNENTLLANSSCPDKIYIEQIMPAKLALNMKYINAPTLCEYFRIIFLTVSKIIK